MKGKVILVGAGPGDPGLLTVRGQSLLRWADVVMTDALVNPRIWQGLRARIIDVGKRGPGAPQGAHQRGSQEMINRMLVRLAQQGNNVVRLKGGDPFVFGRGSEELEALRRAKISFEVVPGVSSAYAVPAYAGIPITDRRFASHVTILTGHEKNEKSDEWRIDWDRLSPKGTLVVFMGVSHWPAIRRELMKRQWPIAHPVAAIEWGTTVRQRVIHSTLAASADDFRRQLLRAPAIVVVGRVAALGRTLNWYRKNRPLLASRVVVMRPMDQASELIAALEDKGATVLLAPVIQIRALGNSAATQRRVRTLQRESRSFDFLVFLSVNAIRCFEPVAPDLSRQWRHAAVAVVGDQSAKVAKEFGWRVAIKPEIHNAKTLLKNLGDVRGKRILIPRAQSAPDDVVKTLHRQGARVEVLPVYRTEALSLSASTKRELDDANVFIFTSASMVHAFMKNFPGSAGRRLLRNKRIVSMGAQTTAVLRRYRLGRLRQARNATIEALAEAAS
jgi:uroporphyrinogen III methyltransferase/synthase